MLLIKFRVHHKSSKNDQADAERPASPAHSNYDTDKLTIRDLLIRGRVHAVVGRSLPEATFSQEFVNLPVQISEFLSAYEQMQR